MKKQLRTTGRSRKDIFLMLAILVAGGLKIAAQNEVFYELHDTKYNKSIVATNALNDVRHEEANGSLKARWKFVHVVDSFYQIIDITNNKAFFRYPTYNTIEIADVSNLDAFLWSLEDVDGRGVHFRIRNKEFKDYLSAHVEGTTGQFGYMYTYPYDLASKEQIWRLVSRQGLTDIPKDTDGREIQSESEYTFPSTNNLSRFTIYGLPNTMCGENPSKAVYQDQSNPTRPTDQAFMNNYLLTQYGAMNQKQDKENVGINYPVSIYAHSTARLNHTSNYVDLLDPFNNDWHGQKERDTLNLEELYTDFYSGEYVLNTWNPMDTSRYGTTSMLARFFFQEQNITNGDPLNNIYLQMPFQVSGIIDNEVPILGYTTEPQIPYLVLHDPPGDLSFSQFSQSKTICRDFENDYTVDEANDIHASVKIGVAGSLGIIVTQDFEFSVEFSGGVTSGDLVVKTNATSNCITINEEFSTSGLEPEGEGESDIFIGYGYDMNYGKYRIVDFLPDSCKAVIHERLIYSLKGSGEDAYTWFVLNEAGIRTSIVNHQAIINSGNATQRDSANALYQINAWQRVLAANDSIIANSTEMIGQGMEFTGNAGEASFSESITVLQTNTLKTEHYLAGRIGMDAVMEIGGSGGSFGYNYTNEKRFGATASQSGAQDTVVSYSLGDDDSGDYFKFNVFRDGRYGTPIFRLTDESKTSCPYEGGNQRDQPRLKIVGQEESEISLNDLPIGQPVEIGVEFWNDSSEPRSYVIQHTGGFSGTAEIKMGSTSITGGDIFETFVIPAHNYLESILNITSQAAQEYPNLKITMYPKCDPALTSDIIVSVDFRTTVVNDENSLVKQLSVYPNPSSGEINATFTLEKPTEISFVLYDILGNRLLLTPMENYSAGDHHKTFHVDELSSGIYQLAINTNQSVISKKVIIQH